MDRASGQSRKSCDGLRIALCQCCITPQILYPLLTLRMSQNCSPWERGWVLPSEPNSGLSDSLLPTWVLPLQLWLKTPCSQLPHMGSCGSRISSPGVQSSLQIACVPRVSLSPGHMVPNIISHWSMAPCSSLSRHAVLTALQGFPSCSPASSSLNRLCEVFLDYLSLWELQLSHLWNGDSRTHLIKL